MATLILRPVSDASLKHKCSSGSNGYSMISEVSADDDSTYIYQAISGTKSSTVQSSFTLGGTMPSGSFKITGAKLYVRAKATSNDIHSGTYKLSIDDSGLGHLIALSTSYQTSSSTDVGASLINNTYTSSTFPSLSVIISTTGSKESSKNSNYQIRITQAYLELEYEAVAVEDNSTIYIKENGNWSRYSAVYKKENGVWVIQSDLGSIFDTNINYVKGN